MGGGGRREEEEERRMKWRRRRDDLQGPPEISWEDVEEKVEVVSMGSGGAGCLNVQGQMQMPLKQLYGHCLGPTLASALRSGAGGRERLTSRDLQGSRIQASTSGISWEDVEWKVEDASMGAGGAGC